MDLCEFFGVVNALAVAATTTAIFLRARQNSTDTATHVRTQTVLA